MTGFPSAEIISRSSFFRLVCVMAACCGKDRLRRHRQGDKLRFRHAAVAVLVTRGLPPRLSSNYLTLWGGDFQCTTCAE